jgi:hypothetical protein
MWGGNNMQDEQDYKSGMHNNVNAIVSTPQPLCLTPVHPGMRLSSQVDKLKYSYKDLTIHLPTVTPDLEGWDLAMKQVGRWGKAPMVEFDKDLKTLTITFRTPKIK